MKKRILALMLGCMLVLAVFAGCSSSSDDSQIEDENPEITEPVDEPPTEIKGKIILSTTTSTEDSGLLAYILPVFTAETGWEVDTIAVGTGAALQMGRDGEADVLLVHSRPDEDQFVEDGYAEQRYDVMYNDYIIVGPADGAIEYNTDVEETFRTISTSGLAFVSRGDDSGTHKKELAIWENLAIDPESNGEYVSAGQGMGATLGMAQELNAYALTDRATWLTFEDKGDLVVVCEKSEDLLNYYGVIPVSASVNDQINTEGGQAFADWIIGDSAQALIAAFGIEEFGEPLFTPNASANDADAADVEGADAEDAANEEETPEPADAEAETDTAGEADAAADDAADENADDTAADETSDEEAA